MERLEHGVRVRIFAIMNATLTPMNIVISKLGMDGHLSSIVQDATKLAFSDAVVASFTNLEEALKCEDAAEGGLLILATPDKRCVAKAVEATDANGLRRWAIVILGATPAIRGAEIVSSDEWSEPLVARVLRSAVAQHQLIRQNESMLGDLRTWAFRISHDLRTPLGGILSTIEALKEILAEHDPNSAVVTKSLFRSVNDMEKLIDRVSMLTKATVSPVPKIPVAMGEVVWAVLQRHEREIVQRSAKVTQPDSWPEVEGVSSWLEVVWGNLVSNALQHGASVSRIDLGWSQSEREFRFWVSDNGDGISPEKIGTLFQPFHLLHHTNARNGLGLSIVQRLVKLQGGRCGYVPLSEGGSRFFFTLLTEKGLSLSDNHGIKSSTSNAD